MPQTGYWPQYYTTTATTTNYIPANQIWYPQNTTTCTGTQIIWQNWNATTTSTYVTQNTYADQAWIQWNQTSIYSPRIQTAEEIERYRAENERRMHQRQAARAKARLLLGEFLDDGQKAELEHHGRFHVTGSKGRRYCIRAEGQSGNVDLLKPDGSLQARLCCHPGGALPEGDAWLMQMIEIRHDEDHLLRTANVHRGRLPALV